MRQLPNLTVAAALAAAALLSTLSSDLSQAWAEPPAAERYELKPVPGGFLRLDRQSGLTAFCTAAGDGYACRPTDEGKSADAAMVAQLEKRVAAIEAKVAELSTDPSRLKGAPVSDPTLDLPTDQQVDRVATFLERAMKRFKKLATDMQKDVDDGSL